MTEQGPKKSGVVTLVTASQLGDKVAFDRLVRLYQEQALRLATGILGDLHDAAEVVQEALVKAYLGLDRLKVPQNFRPWLLRIVANEAISRRRLQRRQAGFLKLAAKQSSKKTAPSPEQERRVVDLKTAVKHAMAQLTAKEAEAITLFGLDDLPHREVGRIMGCSAQATRWHVYRARQKLRHLLKEYIR